MRFLCLATDYDGTLAHDGMADKETWEAVRRFRESGRKVVLVTGRDLDELGEIASPLDRFDGVVAENGGVLYWPASGERRRHISTIARRRFSTARQFEGYQREWPDGAAESAIAEGPFASVIAPPVTWWSSEQPHLASKNVKYEMWNGKRETLGRSAHFSFHMACFTFHVF